MSGAIFYLDEDRDKDPSPSVSPRSSPTSTSDTSRSSPAPWMSSQSSAQPTLQIPQTGSPALLSPQPLPFGQTQPQHRKHAIPFAATPSFPSPLAQAIVPVHSDNSSSSSRSSSNGSDDEADNHDVLTAPSPSQSASSGTPKRVGEPFSRLRSASPHTDRSGSPASTQKSTSRPSSQVRAQILTPGALLMRPKRSSTGSPISNSLQGTANVPLKESPPRNTVPARKESPAHPGVGRMTDSGGMREGLRSAGQSAGRRGNSDSNASLKIPTASGSLASSSPLAFGTSDLDPLDSESSPRGSLNLSPIKGQKEVNVLGLGWGSGWESSSGSLSSPGGSKNKGRSKEIIGPPSPRRERERTMPVGIARYAYSRQRIHKLTIPFSPY